MARSLIHSRRRYSCRASLRHCSIAGRPDPDQLLLPLLATALLMREVKWIGKDTGYCDQGAGAYIGEDRDTFSCSMQVFTHAMRLLAKGGKKSARKVREVVDLLHSDDEQGGNGGGNGDGEVIVIE